MRFWQLLKQLLQFQFKNNFDVFNIENIEVNFLAYNLVFGGKMSSSEDGTHFALIRAGEGEFYFDVLKHQTYYCSFNLLPYFRMSDKVCFTFNHDIITVWSRHVNGILQCDTKTLVSKYFN
jgi:hypothetical protein